MPKKRKVTNQTLIKRDNQYKSIWHRKERKKSERGGGIKKILGA